MRIDLELDFCHLAVTLFISLILLAFIFWDVHYFLRVAFTITWGRLFQKQFPVLDTSSITSIVTTNDLDIMFKHMNNARFVRELDFARFYFYDRSGLYKAITSMKGHVLQTACNIRYRRTIPLFSLYKITTKVIYWDDKTLYLEQQFITNDGFIRAIVHSQQKTIGINVPEIMAKLMGKDLSYRPEILPELQQWLESIETSSNRLRKKD